MGEEGRHRTVARFQIDELSQVEWTRDRLLDGCHAAATVHAQVMRFYVLPASEGKTTFVNFDHVANVTVSGPTIEIHFVGVEAPMIVQKSPTTLAAMGKGMDLSESSKELLSAL